MVIIRGMELATKAKFHLDILKIMPAKPKRTMAHGV